MKIKNKTKRSIRNFVCAILLVLAMLLSSNFGLALGVVNNINFAHAEYEPTDVENPYEFKDTDSRDWNITSNGKSGDALYEAFKNSKKSVDLYNNDYSLKPATKYNGDKLVLEEGEEKSTEIDDYALSLQAENAPTKLEVDKKNDDGDTLYEKDADGNFLFVPKLYTEEEVGADTNLYDYDDVLKGYKKKIQATDANGNSITKYEPEVYDTNNGDTDLYVQIEDTGKYYKKIAKREQADAYYGYKINSDISLKADGWFVFSFWIWTSGTDATVVVSSGETFSSSVLVNNTGEKWIKYYLFIESNGDESTRVSISFFFGYEKSLVAPESTDETATGAIFIDNLCIRNISETDYRTKTVTGEEMPDDKVIQSDSMRYTYEIEGLNGSFNNDLTIEQEMYGEEGYTSLESGLAGYQYEKYVSRYTDDNGDEDRSENKLAEVRWTYNNFFTAEIVDEKTELKVDDIDEETGEPKKEGDETLKKDGPSTFDVDNKILKIENKSDAYALGLLSIPITIRQFGYYKLTLYVKSETQDDKAIIKLISNIKTGNKESKGALQVKSQSKNPYTEDSDATNNWSKISFYIQGSYYYDMQMQIAILADTASKIYVDNIRIESITSDVYRRQSSETCFDLAPSSTTITNSIDGYFNQVTASKVNPDDVKVPYTPYLWNELDDSSDYVTAGIVSTQEKFFNETEFKVKDDEKKTVKAMLGNPKVPVTSYTIEGETPIEMARTNVLAIYAPKKEDMDVDDAEQLPNDWKGHYFGYSSSKDGIGLSANSVYEITFQVYASSVDKAKFEGKIFANLIHSDNHVAEFSFTPTVFDEWQTYTFLVRTGASSTGTSSKTFTLELGVEDATGTVFFQRVCYKAYADKDNPEDSEDKITVDEQFAAKVDAYPTFALQEANRIKFIDFDGDSTSMASVKKVEDKDYYKSLSHSLRTSDDDKTPLVQGEVGVVDTSSEVKLSDTLTLTSSQLNNPNVSLQSALMIYNDNDYATTVYPNTNSSLSSSSYYELSLWVKTIGIKEGSGLTISMSNVSAEFDLVNTENGDFKTTENNGWRKVTVLVETGTSRITGFRIAFELGSDDNKTTGVALISGISLKKLDDEDAYNELVEKVDANDKSTIVKSFAVTEEDDGDDDVDNLTLATFFLVFSSILLVGAIIFAVVAVYIKRVPKKAKAGVDENGKDNTSLPKDGFV